MDIDLFKKSLASKTGKLTRASLDKKVLNESLPVYHITGKVTDVVTTKVGLAGYRARVFLDPVIKSTGPALRKCVIEVWCGDHKDIFKRGETYAFRAEPNPLADVGNDCPAFESLWVEKVK